MAKEHQMALIFGPSPTQDDVQNEPASSQAIFWEPGEPAAACRPVKHESSLPDAEQRARALDIQRSWIVEAPAGSGKTGLLVQRFLKLLGEASVETPGEILAITFTRKAEAEMRHRVMEQLTAAAEDVPVKEDQGGFAQETRRLADLVLARDRGLSWHLLQNPQQLNIRTIDSLCAEIANSTPLLSGSGGRHTPTEDPSSMYELAAERTLLQLGDGTRLDRDVGELLLHRDAQPVDFRRLLADMLRQREQWGELIPLDAEELTDESLDREIRPRLDRTLRNLLEQELVDLERQVGSALLDRWATLARNLSSCAPYKDQRSPLVPCRDLASAPRPEASSLAHWQSLACLVLTGSGWRKSFRAHHLGLHVSEAEHLELTDLVQALMARAEEMPGFRNGLAQLATLPEPRFPDEQWRVTKALCRILRHALLELKLVFEERRSCDFSEVSLSARALLRSEEAADDLLQTAVGHLKHLLVDEMQDTSASQYELLEMLAQHWDGRTQTLFLVGDPKQSIYEFRQARVERFRRVMEEQRFGQLPIGVLRLTANFRSEGTLVHELNNTFEQVFPSLEDLALVPAQADVPFVAASAIRPTLQSQSMFWHFHERSAGGSEPAVASAAEESDAQQIRLLIEQSLSQWAGKSPDNGRPKRVAILGRNRAHLAPVIQELRKDNGRGPLPYRAVDLEPLADRAEILDLLSLTRALMDPADRVAWLSVLRSPVCGLTLDDLLQLTGDGSATSMGETVHCLIRDRLHLLSPAGQAQLSRIWPTLVTALETSGQTSIGTHVERTWRSMGADAPLTADERVNAERYFDLLHKLEADSERLSLGLLRRKLASLYAEPNTATAQVELLTIHKAKGLEWDLVFIPSLHRGSGQNTADLLRWLEFDTPHGAPEFLLAPIQSKGEQSSKLFQWLGRRQQQREMAEAKRVFYVGCTRAREALHLFAAVSRKQDGTETRPGESSSLLNAAWPAAKAAFDSHGAPRSDQPVKSGNVVSFPAPATPANLLSLAAGAEPTTDPSRARQLPVRRLPSTFTATSGGSGFGFSKFSYTPATIANRTAPFARPQGSYAARAFGNVLHRFLEQLSLALAANPSVALLREQVETWQPRLRTAFRAEGLSISQADPNAERARAALLRTLGDPHGVWVLSPHKEASNEKPLPSAPGSATLLRPDRSFYAGPLPGSVERDDTFWILDFKSAELGGFAPDQFFVDQRRKYEDQLRAYAEASVATGKDSASIQLALYFPMLPALISWPFQPQRGESNLTSVQSRTTFVS